MVKAVLLFATSSDNWLDCLKAALSSEAHLRIIMTILELFSLSDLADALFCASSVAVAFFSELLLAIPKTVVLKFEFTEKKMICASQLYTLN